MVDFNDTWEELQGKRRQQDEDDRTSFSIPDSDMDLPLDVNQQLGTLLAISRTCEMS